jgi:uncharacterized protein
MLSAVWVEIPVSDFERALKFYQTVFGLAPTEILDDGVRRTTTLTNGTGEGAAGISLNKTADFHPSDRGPLVYFMFGERKVEEVMQAAVEAGGRVTTPLTSMGTMGNYALIHDSEGNALALYSVPTE